MSDNDSNNSQETAASDTQSSTAQVDSGMGLLPFMAAVVGLFLIAGGSIYYIMSGSDGSDTPGEAATAALNSSIKPDVSLSELMETGPLEENSLGADDAPVTIVEYSSMTCPHCATFHADTLPGLKEKYIDTGKVRYIIREFPLDKLAAAAFMLARCAGKDRYFPLIDALYAQQATWAYGKGDPTPRLFKATRLAGASFTKESFEACLQRQDLLDGINWVRERGAKFNIRSTPSFFVNGKLLGGAQPLEKFEELIEPHLK